MIRFDAGRIDQATHWPVLRNALAAIALSPESLTLTEIGQTAELVAIVKDENGGTLDGPEVFWSSSDTTVAAAAGDGARALLTPVGNGTAIVSASTGAIEANVAVTVDISQRSVLLEIYGALGGDEWRRNLNWGTAAPLDMWHGVVTDAGGNVTELGLRSNGLSGLIPPVIGMLESLDHLDLGANSLTGPIPPELGNLDYLGWLRLEHNELTGSIPSELGDLPSLESLRLSHNGLTGQIPPRFAGLGYLHVLEIDNTALSGPLPRELLDISLGRFHWNETDLCAPADTEFQRWLASIGDQIGNRECSP